MCSSKSCVTYADSGARGEEGVYYRAGSAPSYVMTGALTRADATASGAQDQIGWKQ